MDSDKYVGMMLDNRYEILEKIGSGGMAVVYRARCHRLNRLVAVKILKDELREDEDFRRRFKVESQAVAMLSHPNIVAVYDVSKQSSIEYIVMELIEGITLKQYINRKGLLNWKETVHFATQIAKALSHAHVKGIIHRDIKPHNIMILKDGSIKVADFGIARLLSTQYTQTRESFGSVHYISPEQAKGSQVDARSDLYSLGVVMYEMLTSQLPFVGDTAVAVAIQHINAIPLSPREINPDVPPGLEDITMHAMEPRLAARYETAEEMLSDLEDFRKNPSGRFFYPSAGVVDEESTFHETRSVPTSAVRGAITNGTSSQRSSVPVKKAKWQFLSRNNSKPVLSRDEQRIARRRAQRTAMLLGTGAVSLVVIFLLVYLWQNYLKSWFYPQEAQVIYVHSFVGQNYREVMSNPIYTENYTFTVVAYINHETVPQDAVISQDPPAETEKTKTESKIPVNLTVSLGSAPPVLMPDFSQSDYREAVNQLRSLSNEHKLNLEIQQIGQYDPAITRDYVISTIPKADTALSNGMSIYVTYSLGPEQKLIEVPDVVGLTLSAAILELESHNLVPGEPMYVESDLPKDEVVFQTLKGELVPAHTEIKLQISSGPPAEPSPTPTPTPTPVPETPSPTPEATPPFSTETPAGEFSGETEEN